MKDHLSIAVIGAGPSGLFVFKKLIDAGIPNLHIDFFERNGLTGAGMPYSQSGARAEHITNVSANEIPNLETTITEWIQTVDPGELKHYHINPEKFSEYKVLPRLLFGRYLNAQFQLLQQKAKEKAIRFHVYYNTEVTDIHEDKRENRVTITTAAIQQSYDRVIICSGHHWPLHHEQHIPGYYDSPYPPSKLAFQANHPIAIKGASLTAIDALRTLSRQHGNFFYDQSGNLQYLLNSDASEFRLVMHSRNGMLPAVRFHLDDSTLSKDTVLSKKEIEENKKINNGFVSLDYVFERNFKDLLKEKQPEFYEKIRDMQIEEFVGMMMRIREKMDPFELLKKEYEAAEKSIHAHQSIFWKEMLAVLSFSMNYPAKYFSAEDMLRLQKTLMPLISIVIAFVPQSSAQEMMALYEAGVLSLVSVGDDSSVDIREEGGVTYRYSDERGEQSVDYRTFVDCTGQPHLQYEDFPYKSLREQNIVSAARLKFRDAAEGKKMLEAGDARISKDATEAYYLRVPGVAINDYFQVTDHYNALNDKIYIMAVSLIGGYNPDYSGLDFCEAASTAIVNRIKSEWTVT